MDEWWRVSARWQQKWMSASSLAGRADPEGDRLLSLAQKSKKWHWAEP